MTIINLPRPYKDSESDERAMRVADLVRLMQASGGPDQWPSRVPWPLHQALFEAREALQQVVLRGSPVDLAAVPCPDVGWKVEHVEGAIRELERSGLVRLVEVDPFRCQFLAQEGARQPVRRELMLLDPAEAAVIYRAALRWRALASTSLKNLRISASPPSETVRSSIPILRHAPLP